MEALQPPPLGLALISAFFLCGGNAMQLLVTQLAAKGTIGPNGFGGYRTAATRSSEAAWLRGHRAALPASRAGAMTGMLLAVGSALAAGTVMPYLVLLTLAALVTLGHTIAGLTIAHRAARRAEN